MSIVVRNGAGELVTISTIDDLLDVVSSAAKQDVGNAALATLHADLVALGEVQASPTANTVLDRLKALHTDLAALTALFPAALGSVGSFKIEGVGGMYPVVVGGTTPLITGQVIRPGDATTYSLGDHIANSQTAGSVVPITFTMTSKVGGSGRVTGARCVATAASGTNLVLPNFDLLLFRPAANIPFAAGSYPADNAALLVSSAAMKEMVCALPFRDTTWRNSAGGISAAGLQAWQPTNVDSRAFANFSLASLGATTLLGIMQVQNAWAPGNVQYTFDFRIDADVD